MKEPELILVVDDEDLLRMNMRAFLEDLGYRVVEAARGMEALETSRLQAPDLILLDVNMPGMDGFETCGRLKEDPATAEIPVLFLSAILGAEDKVKAFRTGAVDYVTKPFQLEEVEARIGLHLELHRQRRKLRQQNDALLRLESLRDTLIHMIAHDMRSPLTIIIGTLDLLATGLEGQDPRLLGQVERARTTAERLTSMITTMLDMSRLESGEMPLHRKACDLAEIARGMLQSVSSLQAQRRIWVTSPESVRAAVDPEIIGRVLENLLVNAIKFTAADGLIEIRIQRDGGLARVALIDNGPGIAAEHLPRLFEKFGQVGERAQRSGAGLGLAFCRLAVEAHYGKVGVSSEVGKGSEFWFEIPVGEPGAGTPSPL